MEKSIIMAAEYWNSDNDYLIIQSKTGIFYSDQIGGMACRHSKIEGFYYPLWFMIDDKIACDKGCFWIQEKHNRKNRQLIADSINKQIKEQTKKSIINLEFNYDKIDEMEESFYPVKIHFNFNHDFYNNDNKFDFTGFLITDNCD